MPGPAITRRNVLAAAIVTSILTLGGNAAVLATEETHPAVRFMQKAAQDLMAAQRRGTIDSFTVAIRRHADVPSIGLYSLGKYQKSLGASQRGSYFAGVTKFMAWYFAENSRQYQVVNAEIDPSVTEAPDNDVQVRTRLLLASGSTYNVAWRLGKSGQSWKIKDIKVLGFSLTYLQQRMFLDYLSKKDGNLSELIAALNRR